jgi:alpha-mannosidase
VLAATKALIGRFHNLDKFIHYVNLNASRGGPVVAMYSTPTVYTSAKQRVNLTWEVRHDDIFPLADNDHAVRLCNHPYDLLYQLISIHAIQLVATVRLQYWSGYFTSRPALKRQVRVNSNLLNAARQLEIVTKTTTGEVDTPTIRPSPAVGTSWTDSLEGTVGVATHHGAEPSCACIACSMQCGL